MYSEQPSDGLTGAVRWTMRGGGDGLVLPDGCMDLVWLGDDLLVAGPDTRAHRVPGGPELLAGGVRLPPGLAPVLLGVPAHELVDTRCDLAALWGDRRGRRWRDGLAESDDPAALLDRRVVAEIAQRGEQRSAAVAAMARWSSSGVPVATMAERLGVDARTVRRWALDAFGYGPRLLTRVLRAQRAVGLLGAGVPVAQAAVRAGYADQPHLSRDLRVLTGLTPSMVAARG